MFTPTNLIPTDLFTGARGVREVERGGLRPEFQVDHETHLSSTLVQTLAVPVVRYAGVLQFYNERGLYTLCQETRQNLAPEELPDATDG